jgi:uncharacterized membrane protein
MRLIVMSSFAVAILSIALPVGATTNQKVQPQSDKAVAAAPASATRFILAAKTDKAKAKKTKKRGVKAKQV